MALNKISSLRRHVKIGIMNKRLFTIGGFDIPALLIVVVTTHVLGVLSGIVPALAIGFGTKQPEKESVRTDEISSLKKIVSRFNDPRNQSYIVVVGPKGIGKSCLIDTALKDTRGVLRVEIAPGDGGYDVRDKCTSTIAGASLPFFLGFFLSDSKRDSKITAENVIYWHRRFFGYAPTLVVATTEVPKDREDFAHITGEVRTIAEMGMRVIVDPKPNSMCTRVLHTKRQSVLHVEEMSSEQIRSLPQLADLFTRLDAHPGLSGVVHNLLGTNPADFEELARKDKDSLSAEPDVRTAVEALCMERLGVVQLDYDSLITDKDKPNLKKIFSLFKTNNALSNDVFEGMHVPARTHGEFVFPKFRNELLQVQRLDWTTTPMTPMADFFFKNSCDFTTAKEGLLELIWGSPSPSSTKDTEVVEDTEL